MLLLALAGVWWGVGRLTTPTAEATGVSTPLDVDVEAPPLPLLVTVVQSPVALGEARHEVSSVPVWLWLPLYQAWLLPRGWVLRHVRNDIPTTDGGTAVFAFFCRSDANLLITYGYPHLWVRGRGIHGNNCSPIR
jgi:hypothetical protein